MYLRTISSLPGIGTHAQKSKQKKFNTNNIGFFKIKIKEN
jgi:hypothetical protein